MPNPLYNQFENQGGMGNIAQQFANFKKGFTGNAEAEVRRMLNSGEMSQAQFNQLHSIARQMGLIK